MLDLVLEKEILNKVNKFNEIKSLLSYRRRTFLRYVKILKGDRIDYDRF